MMHVLVHSVDSGSHPRRRSSSYTSRDLTDRSTCSVTIRSKPRAWAKNLVVAQGRKGELSTTAQGAVAYIWIRYVSVHLVLWQEYRSVRNIALENPCWFGSKSRKSIANHYPALLSPGRGCRRIFLLTFAHPYALHSVVVGPFILTPRKCSERWFNTSGLGCPSRKCQRSAEPDRSGYFVHELYASRRVPNNALVIGIGMFFIMN